MKDQSGETSASLPNEIDSDFWSSIETRRHPWLRNIAKVAGTLGLAAIVSVGVVAGVQAFQSITTTERWGVPVKDSAEDTPPITIGTTTTTIGRCALENLGLEANATMEEALAAAQRCEDETGFELIETLNEQARTSTTPRS